MRSVLQQQQQAGQKYSSGTGSHIRRPGFHAVSSSAMLENFFYGGDMGAALRCLQGTVNTTKDLMRKKIIPVSILDQTGPGGEDLFDFGAKGSNGWVMQ